MTGNRWLELGVGLFVVGGLAALAVLAFKVGNLSSVEVADGYRVVARFDNIGQLKVKAPVTLAGVRVGRVTHIEMDDNFYAVVTMTLSGHHKNIPKDTGASIRTAGLLGEQYIALEPGGEEEALKDGDEITLTQSALVLEKLISQFLYSKAEGATPGKK